MAMALHYITRLTAPQSVRSSTSLARESVNDGIRGESNERSRSLLVPISSGLAQMQTSLEEQEAIAKAAIAH